MFRFKEMFLDTKNHIFAIVAGHFLIAAGIFLLLMIGHGMDSWSVLSEGVAVTLGIPLGLGNTLIGVITIIASIVLKEIPGVSTFFSVFLVGVFIDLFNQLGLFYDLSHLNILIHIPLIVIACFSLTYGVAVYISIGLGAGSRDAILVWFLKLLPLPVSLSKFIIDFMVIALGVLLGGTFGYGTLISLIILGPLLEISFKLVKFDARTLKQKTFLDYIPKKN